MYISRVSYFLNGSPVALRTLSQWVLVEIGYDGDDIFRRVIGGAFEENDYWFELVIRKR